MTLTANDPAASSITLLDGTTTGKWALLDGADFGDAVWDVAYSGARGTLGALPTSSRVQNRVVNLPLGLWPDDMDDSAAQRAALTRVVDLMRIHGGRITFQRTDQAVRQHLVVFAGGVTSTPWTVREELDGRAQVRLQFTCDPYVNGDQMRITDTFAADTEANYTFDSSGFGAAAGNVTISSNRLNINTSGQLGHMIHTSTGLLFGDHQVAVRFIIPSLADTFIGAVLKRVAAGSMLTCRLADNGSSSLIIDTISGSSYTNLVSTGITRITAGTPYWVIGRIEGNTVYCELWSQPPTLDGTAVAATSAVLSGSAKTTFGEGTTGQAGMNWYTAPTGPFIEGFDVRPYVYRGANFTGRAIPERIRLDGAIPGDAPARAEIEVAVGPGASLAASTARFGLIAHTQRPVTHNLLPDGGFELTDTFQQWAATAVTGVLANAGTSITRVTTAARYGAASAQIVAPATANSGARCAIYHPHGFRPGVTYTAELWTRSAAGTTNMRIRLGVSGDIGSETAAALSATWTRRTVTWTPTARTTIAYLVAEITAATATTFQIDGCMVYEGTTAPSLASQSQGMAGRPPFGVVDAVDRIGTAGTVDLAGGSTYLNGRRLTFSATTGTGGVDYLIDPALLPTDPHSPAQAVEFYLMAHVPLSTQTTIITSLGPVGNNPAVAETYTSEYGPNGVTVTPGTPNNFHLFRLGTINLPTPQAGVIAPMRLRIIQEYASNQTFHYNYVLMVPAQARACSPSGLADITGYPVFAQTGELTSVVRRFTDDLQGYTQATGVPHQVVAPPLEGNLITPGPGAVDMLTAFANNVPAAATALYGAVNGHRIGALAVTPTPRWHYLRDA
jgi:hypothetical protein